MLSNFHTHSTYCDGDNTLEEMVLSAIDKGFDALGFSGHAYGEHDTDYCMLDTKGYIAEVKALKEKYKKDIQIYLGIEEDIIAPSDRDDFEYIITSSHHIVKDGKVYHIDSSHDGFKECLSLFGGDAVALAEEYYSKFCDAILKRKPHIIGHFDLITKYDELGESQFLNNGEYLKTAKKYLLAALKSDSLFEVNTGAISRNCRTSPYPHIELLYELKKQGGKLIISSDSHAKDSLDCKFSEVKQLLKDIGFEYTYTLYNSEFTKDYL